MRLFLLALLAGCAFHDTHPGQDAATDIVWSTYARTDSPPDVEWREDDCGDSSRAGVAYDGACFAGVSLDGNTCLVAWRGSFSGSAFAHELLHAAQYRDGIEDPAHTLPAWGEQFHRPRGLLDVAGDALRERGL